MSEVPDHMPEDLDAATWAPAIPAKGGRKHTRTEKLDQIAYNALAIGLTYRLTAQLLGVAPRTFRQWREEDDDYAAFLESARAAGIKSAMCVVIDRIRHNDLKAATWFLEKRAHELMPEAPPDSDDVSDDQVQSLASQLRFCRDQMDASVPAAPTEQAA